MASSSSPPSSNNKSVPVEEENHSPTLYPNALEIALYSLGIELDNNDTAAAASTGTSTIPADFQTVLNALTANVNTLTENICHLTAKVNAISHRLEVHEQNLDSHPHALMQTVTDLPENQNNNHGPSSINRRSTRLQQQQQEVISHQLQRQEQRIDALMQSCHENTTGLEVLSQRFQEQTVRNLNQSCIRTNRDIIRPIPHPGRGDEQPNWMPRNLEDLMTWNVRKANRYLRFYNLRGTRKSLKEKRRMIKEHIGITI